jgi:hypothetical protein
MFLAGHAGVSALLLGIMEMRNPHPPDALPRRKRMPFAKEVPLDQEELQRQQDEKQTTHGRMVSKQLEATASEQRRAKQTLKRGQPTVRDEMQEAVMARMGPSDIPTKGNTT